MKNKETGVVLMSGSAIMAPVYKPADGDSPWWSGRISFEIEKDVIESVMDFCMEDAYALGYDDGVINMEERTNPFHRNFMHGIPYSVFMTYYRRGRSASQRTCAQVIQLFAMTGAVEAR